MAAGVDRRAARRPAIGASEPGRERRVAARREAARHRRDAGGRRREQPDAAPDQQQEHADGHDDAPMSEPLLADGRRARPRSRPRAAAAGRPRPARPASNAARAASYGTVRGVSPMQPELGDEVRRRVDLGLGVGDRGERGELVRPRAPSRRRSRPARPRRPPRARRPASRPEARRRGRDLVAQGQHARSPRPSASSRRSNSHSPIGSRTYHGGSQPSPASSERRGTRRGPRRALVELRGARWRRARSRSTPPRRSSGVGLVDRLRQVEEAAASRRDASTFSGAPAPG